ncbi:MAG TPA: metallopeptidase TldD-related protein [Jatrophihabitantaceae bacterium]|jgi:predicted Zn-dependent protease
MSASVRTGLTEFAAPFAEDQLLDTLDTAVRSDAADEFEIAVLARAGEYTRFAGEVIHQPQDITEVQYLVRAVVDGHAARTATTIAGRLPDIVRLAADAARERARGAAAPGNTELGGTDQPDCTVPRELLWYDDTAAFDVSARVQAARSAMQLAQSFGDSAAGMFGRAVTQQAVATSRGLRRATAATEASGSLTASAADGTSHWTDLARSADRLRLAESVHQTVTQAVAGRNRQVLPPGTYPVVLGGEAVGDLLQFLPELGFAGDLAAAGIGIVATRAGEPLVAEIVDVADDATVDLGLPIGFDIEGTAKLRVPFFAGGRVGEPFTDLAVAGAMGRRSTGHAHIAREEVPAPSAANIVMTPGAFTEAELIASVERGVYIQRFWYTRLVDRTAGTITGVTRDACFVIENGRLTTPLQGMRFTQSVLACLAGVEAIGCEVRSQPVMNVWNGATSAPPVRAAAFRFGAAPLDDDAPKIGGDR